MLCSKSLFAQVGYLGEIKLIACNYAPKGWALCQGQLLLINQNQALYSLLGTTYGGNGITTFALPDYRGRVAVGAGNTVPQGAMQGAETAILTQANIPTHNHNQPIKVSSSKATLNVPTVSSAIASPSITVNAATRDMLGYKVATPNTPLSGTNSTATGAASPTPIPTMQPFLGMNYIIALQGIFPSTN